MNQKLGTEIILKKRLIVRELNEQVYAPSHNCNSLQPLSLRLHFTCFSSFAYFAINLF